MQQYWCSVLRPQFPGKIGCGIKSRKRNRGEKAKIRRKLRTEFRKAPRVPGLSFKSWLKLKEESEKAA